jgi:hypothetical protein
MSQLQIKARDALAAFAQNVPAVKLADVATKKAGIIALASTAVFALGISARTSIQYGVSSLCKKVSDAKKSVTAFAKNHPTAVKVSAAVVATGICVGGAKLLKNHSKKAAFLADQLSNEPSYKANFKKKEFQDEITFSDKNKAAFRNYFFKGPSTLDSIREFISKSLSRAPVATPVVATPVVAASEALKPTKANLAIAAKLQKTFAKPLVVLPKSSMADSVRGIFASFTKKAQVVADMPVKELNSAAIRKS